MKTKAQRIYYGRRAGPHNTAEVMVHTAEGVRLLDPKKSLAVRNHSPTGFEWGYGGSGPAQLSLALLLDLFGPDVAEKGYQEFKGAVTCRMPHDFWELTAGEIEFWMQTSLDNQPEKAHAYFSAKWEGARQAKEI